MTKRLIAGLCAFIGAFAISSVSLATTPGGLPVNCVLGCSAGAASNGSDAQATSSTNGQTDSWLFGYNGTTWDRLRVDGSKNLDVNCIVGCSAGSSSNASDAVSTSSTNGATDSWLFGFNGTTWDRLRVDGSKNLDINCVVGCTASTLASGAVASGAYAAGALAAGAGVDGWDLTQGAKADTCAGSGSNCSVDGRLQDIEAKAAAIATSAATTATNTGLPLPACSGSPCATTVGNTGQANGDPCTLLTHNFTPISISSAANTKIVAGTTSKKTYICHITLQVAGSDNIGVVEGTGTNCATSTTGVIGGNTAATGFNFVANQGVSLGEGNNATAATATAADDLCLITSAGTQLTGVVVWVQS